MVVARWIVAAGGALLGALVASAPSAAGAMPARATVAFTPAAHTTTELLAQSKAVMAVDPQAAVRLARTAEAGLLQQPVGRERQLEIATARWLAGEGLMRLNDIAAATPLILSALQASEQLAPGSKLTGSLLSSHAGLQSTGGHLDKALNDYQRAFALFRRLGDQRAEAVALQNIGSIYQEAADYDRVLYYYGLSAETYGDDPLLKLSSGNNRGNALDQLGRHAEAEREYEAALAIATSLGNTAVRARILDNLAQSQLDQGKLAEASRSVSRGLALATGQDAAGWYPLLLGTAARLALRTGDEDRAISLLERGFRAAGDQADTAPYRDMHQTAYQAYKQRGDVVPSLRHFEIFKRLDDQGRSLAASTGATLAAARFDFANQNNRIAALKTGQLQRDIALSKMKARQLQIIIGALLGLAAIGGVMLALYLRSLRRSGKAIAASNAKLRVSNVALEDALLAKTQFLATTSHEIRTPLNGVLGMTQVLLADPDVAGDVRDRVGLIHQAGETMRVLVDDILDAAKNDAEAFDLERTLVILPDLLREVISFWTDKATAAQLSLDLDLSQCPATIVEDATRLRQIVHNLIANAIKFTPTGRVSVTVETPAVDGGEQLQIRCADTGIGIPASRFDDVFEKFVQIDGGITRQFGGTGLGLAICRKLSRAMGGDVTVESTPGVGSCFTLLLPLHRGPAFAEAVADSHGASRPSLALAAVTVMQPNPLARGMVSAILSGHVGTLAFVDTLAAALARASTATDLVLVDVSSVAAQGIAAHSELRGVLGQLATQAVPAVLLWPGDTDAGAATNLADATGCKVIFKPISAGDLVAGLKAALDLGHAGALECELAATS